MNKITIVFILIGLSVLGGGYLWWRDKTTEIIGSTESQIKFVNPVKSPHWVSNTPEHGVILPDSPINVVIDFNFDVAKGSEVQIINNDIDYGEGQTIIDPNNLVLRRAVKTDAPDGIYTVKYKACWPDGSCHNGQFQFGIDNKQASSFTDMRNQNEVLIDMKNFVFTPRYVLVSKGTKIVWTNKDTVEHSINTDSHPAHTYFLPQNSRLLKQNETFSTVFNLTGVYPYHCTPHASNMTGMILVE